MDHATLARLAERESRIVDFLVLHDARLAALEQLVMEIHPAGRAEAARRLLDLRGATDSTCAQASPAEDQGSSKRS